MLKEIAVCRSSHSPHFDGRGSPIGAVGAGSPARCRLVPQVVAFPVEPAHVEESAAVDHLAFANLDRFLLQLQTVVLNFIFGL